MRTATLIVVISVLLRPEALGSSPLTSLKQAVRRNIAEDDVTILDECVRMTSSPGQYVYVSPGRDDVCGLFVVGTVNQVVAIEFTDFSVDCDDGGLVVVVDGWEIDGQVFPSISDHFLSIDERFRGYCGADRPTGAMIMSQNVALIQFRMPRRLQRFRVRISYHYNPAPCNVISTAGDGSATLSNYGLRRNCTVLVVYPELIDIVRMDVGQIISPSTRSAHRPSTIARATQHHRHLHACTPGGRDYVEVLGGFGLDTSSMSRFVAVCGLHAEPGDVIDRAIQVAKPYTAIRLVSSGWSYNSVTFRYQKLTIADYDD